jgi:hypothetical protein
VRNDHGKHYQLESFDAARRLASPLFYSPLVAEPLNARPRTAQADSDKICRNLTDIGGKTI